MPVWPPVLGERPPSSMVPSVLVNKAQGSKLVIGGAGGELIISAVVQVRLGILTKVAPVWEALLFDCPPGSGWEGWCGSAGAPPPLHPLSPTQTLMNKLWLGADLAAAIAAPILHVNSKGAVEYEATFSQVSCI